MLKLSLLLGALAALADVAGGLVLVRARGIERWLRYLAQRLRDKQFPVL